MPLRLAANREILRALSGHERWTYALAAQINETHLGKQASTLWSTYVARPGLALSINNRIHLEGAEHLPTDRSLILAANHRTYFDFYAALIATWPCWQEKPYVYCPVRSTFYYDGPLGAALNWTVSGTSMYPPIYRSEDRRVLNHYAVAACVRLLEWAPRALVAMHPEGKRNKSDDPYAFLAPKPGIGRIALRSDAPVIPFFVAGLPGQFGELVRARMAPDAEPVRVLVGQAVDLGDLKRRPDDPAAHQEVAERVMGRIARLAERDREIVREWRETRK